jgi:dCMP deaminase
MTKDKKYMALAEHIGSSFSKDRSTRIGAVIVGEGGEILSTGYNGFPRNFNDENDENHERPMKYALVSHAERNSIYNAARNGIKLLGSKIYISEMIPCNDCVKAIIQSGIKKVYLNSWAFSKDNVRGQVWMEQWTISKMMLDECGIEIIIRDDTDQECR